MGTVSRKFCDVCGAEEPTAGNIFCCEKTARDLCTKCLISELAARANKRYGELIKEGQTNEELKDRLLDFRDAVLATDKSDFTVDTLNTIMDKSREFGL